ncbi:MAG: UDP-2,3-diacylglucosamine diphosphatase [Proteobacteria bacterium]|nr:UDP-2,3-diacylglucosamine diphosphatase [Pseudomonadota bacterium]TDJ35803.1 MAG: UDP-2,3-diacylglucosamine diphosphatase [Gammaproteobacteria bacterium]
MTTLFISDLHLDAGLPEISKQLLIFLKDEAASADALYILGDLFESWVGDDDPNPHYATVKNALRKLVGRRVPVYFMHGNRDFAIGEKFAQETGVQILPDPHVVELYGESVLLSHGDRYCTDDVQYQTIRKMTRDPKWLAMMLKKPLRERLAFAAQARAASAAHGGAINQKIANVNQRAIERAMREANVDTMLHGHTHRPGIHRFNLDGEPASRIVLGDWFTQGSVVRWDESGPVLSVLQR